MCKYDENNVFAKIIRGEIPCDEIYQDKNVLAFKDVSPAAKIHILVIPKSNFISFDDYIQNESPDKIVHFFKIIQKISSDLGLKESGYRLITNYGSDANQTVPHFHAHILAGENLGGLIHNDNLNR